MQSGLTRQGAAIFIAALLFLFVGAAAAQAAEFTVNSTGDQPDAAVGSGGCQTSLGTCTLRAAIEESNASVGVTDSIKFSQPMFDGQLGSTVELRSPLPTITGRVSIEGADSPYQCETAYYETPGPCTGIEGPTGGTAFRVSAEDVRMNGLAISGARTAIEAVGGPGLFLWNDWFGLKLDGSAGPVETGVFLDQDSNNVRIGGVYSESRDIFAHNTGVGVNIDGADSTEILGDGFGVMPDGATPAPDGTNIEVGDAATGENRTARANRIGRRVEENELASSTCDGGCNVIAAAEGSGVDLAGNGIDEQPVTGGTRILGNYIGVDAFGGPLPNTDDGVVVGSAFGITIGGPVPEDRNLIDGGTDSVRSADGDELSVEGNWIGLNVNGTGTQAPPSAAGIAVEGGTGVEIFGNRISLTSGSAIETGARESLIRGNVIGEGVTGARLPGGVVGVLLPEECRDCAQVYDNSISGASEYGVWVEESQNQLYGNDIERSGKAGIYIEQPGTLGYVRKTLVGGDAPAEENTISESGGSAIEIVAGPESGATRKNIVARNHGSSNAGPFIALVNGANNGIQPPSFSASTVTGASGGGAEPGATIRVFRKADSSPGEVEGFLAEAKADEDGDWSVTYPGPIPAGTMVAATQSAEEDGIVELADGTSELAFAVTTVPSTGGSWTGGEVGGTAVTTTPQTGVKTSASAPKAPETTIVNGPSVRSRATVARFRFRSDQGSAHFRCQLDGGPIAACASPKTYRRLQVGKHVFKVWAVSTAGLRDPTPARWTFRVERRR